MSYLITLLLIIFYLLILRQFKKLTNAIHALNSATYIKKEIELENEVQ